MIRYLFLAPVLVMILYAVYAMFKYTRLISSIFLSLVYRPNSDTPSGRIRGERITILDSGDEEIEALLIGKSDVSRAVIFCHESGSNKESWEKYAYFLPDLGWSVLSVDLAGPSAATPPGLTGNNPLSQWPTEEEVRKLIVVIRWAKRAFRSDTALVLFGVSNGADIALAAAEREPAIRAVIADGLFSMKEIFRDYIRRWAPILVRPDFFQGKYPKWVLDLFASLSLWHAGRRAKKTFIDVETLLARRHPPLLMIYGQEDDYVPATHQRYLTGLDRSRSALQTLVVPKAKHNQAVQIDRDVYEKDILQFLKNYVRLGKDRD